MTKLINRYRKMPSPANRVALAKYIAAHAMAVCFADQAELEFLRANEFAF